MLIEILLFILITIGIINLVLVVTKKTTENNDEIKNHLVKIDSNVLRTDTLLREELARSRQENQISLKENREELNNSFKNFSDSLTNTIKSFEDKFSQNIKDFNEILILKFSEMINRHENIKKETEEKLKEIRETVEKKLQNIQDDNNKKLEEMRATVDEKLQSTLEKRLSESFKQVSERLDLVHRGLGEMQTVASEVSDLKKVLSSSKNKGIIGEILLGSILENILSPGQYQKNVKTKANSNDHVEYAIVLPGKDDSGKPVFLPVDSKFPTEAYSRLVDAYENSNPDEIKQQSKEFYNAILKAAKDIHDKYIDPPQTTDFGILFLPSEGLYAEVVRNYDIMLKLNQELKVMVAGPSTLTALLNSLQMGFRTLYIEKRSNEVWRVLQAVKTEFSKFEETLKKAKDKIEKAGEDLNELVGTRTKKINSKLRDLQELPDDEAQKILSKSNNNALNDDE
jgi:DNA recombination protein RmuC